MQNKFFVSTPIYYGNGLPHVGHFYSSTIANTIYLYNKISGKNTRFTTGIDENSQKSVMKAEEKGMDIWDYVDMMAKEHQEVWDFFNFRYTDFIRTTEERHHKVVQDVLQKCYDKGDIYEGIYEGMYCVGCEAFKKEEDLIERNGEKVCPDHLIAPQFLKEKNYFFKLSKYQTWLEEMYKANPNFIIPDFRFNEVKAFVERGLEDFSISRETNTFGIPLPFDETQVTYVWFDALENYWTSCKYSRGGDKNNTNWVDESDFWVRPDYKNDKILHIVGKDIIRFHGIFWPCMLASYFEKVGEEKNGVIHFKESDFSYIPNNVLTGGFFTVDGQKMSKTIGNVINPTQYSEQYSKELLILYMLSAFSIGRDGDYDRKDAILTYNAKLANNFGNLLNRAVVLTLKLDSELKRPRFFDSTGIVFDEEDAIRESEDTNSFLNNNSTPRKIKDYNLLFDSSMIRYDLKSSLDITFRFLDDVNNFVTETEPWTMMKDSSKIEETKEVMYSICESIRIVALNLYPFFSEKMSEIFIALNLTDYADRLEKGELQELREEKVNFDIKDKAPILFEKFDVE